MIQWTYQKDQMPTKEEMAKFAKEIDKLVSETDYNYIEAITVY